MAKIFDGFVLSKDGGLDSYWENTEEEEVATQ